jgi:hypothetical protein
MIIKGGFSMSKSPLSMQVLESSRGYSAYDITELHYDPNINMMIDECGVVVSDIYRIISPNTLFLFKTNKQNMNTWDKAGNLIVLLYPEEAADRYDC